MHENAGNLGLRMDWFEFVHKSLDVNVLCYSYRGYGRSEGVPSEAGIKSDSIAIVDSFKTCARIDSKRVFLCGRSLGGAVALDLISKLDRQNEFPFKGVMIENTFTGISDMADTLFPFLKQILPLKKLMLRIHWDNQACVKYMKTPVLFVTGDQDTFVPTWMTLALHSACTSDTKDLMVVPGGNHNNTFSVAGYAYINRFKKFIKVCKELPCDINSSSQSCEGSTMEKK